MSRRRFLFNVFACIIMMAVATAVQAQDKQLRQLHADAAKAVKSGQWKEADQLYQEYVNQYTEEGLPKGFDYTEALSYLVRRALSQGRVDDALTMQKEIVEVRSTSPDCTDDQQASAMSDLASVYAQKAQYHEAVQMGEDAVKALKQCLGPKHQFTCIAQANLANYYSARGEQGDVTRAVQLCEEAVKHMKHGTADYAKALDALVLFYTKAGDLAAASAISKKAKKEVKKRLDEDGVGYAIVLINQAIRLANAGNYDDAYDYAAMARETYQQSGSTTTISYAKMLLTMATFSSHKHNYTEAEQLLTEALPLLEQIVGKSHPDYVRCVSELSTVYKNMGNMEKADEIAHLSDRLGQNLGDRDNRKYALSLSRQATVFALNGNYERAIEHQQRAIKIYEGRGDSLSMAFAQSILSNYLFSNGQQQEALQKTQEAISVYRRGKVNSAQYGQVLNNSSILYFNLNDYDQAADYGRQALQVYRHLGDTASVVFARILANNALYSHTKGDTRQALQQSRQAVSLHTQLLGDSHPDNVPLLYNMAVFENQEGLLQQSQQTLRKALRLQAEQVRTNFLYLTSQERESFWNRKSYVFKYVPLLAYRDRESGRMNEDAYNALLFTKGILLNSDVDFKSILLRSGDATLIEQYNQLEQLHKEEENLYKQASGAQMQDRAQAIREQTYQLERALVKGCKEYGQFTEMLDIRASQVSESLAPEEAAIEFTDFHVDGVGRVYVAFLLRHGQSQPMLIRLFDDLDLSHLSYRNGTIGFHQAMKTPEGINEIYNDPRIGSLVWKPIIKHLDGVKRIYFSPTSLFYQLAIEYLHTSPSERICQTYDVYRLSTTKSLVNRHVGNGVKRAAVYGGLSYDMDLAQLTEHHRNIVTGEEYLASLSSPMLFADTDMDISGGLRALDSLSVRGSVGFLEGTLHEAENIVEQLMQHGVRTRVFSGDDGTEETFKALSGQDLDLIHIATHGFYFSPEDLHHSGLQLMFSESQDNGSDNTLNYSGLLLSGANYVLTGNKLPESIENGVLTSREIAKLDLGRVGLVVLSACQTGLGDIREDGVFGIQRGFKKAGVQSLIMSLWKVDDRATFQMMTCFYVNLMAGLSRHEAFEKAQQTMREGKFSDPYYWASFIMLDGQNE